MTEFEPNQEREMTSPNTMTPELIDLPDALFSATASVEVEVPASDSSENISTIGSLYAANRNVGYQIVGVSPYTKREISRFDENVEGRLETADKNLAVVLESADQRDKEGAQASRRYLHNAEAAHENRIETQNSAFSALYRRLEFIRNAAASEDEQRLAELRTYLANLDQHRHQFIQLLKDTTNTLKAKVGESEMSHGVHTVERDETMNGIEIIVDVLGSLEQNIGEASKRLKELEEKQANYTTAQAKKFEEEIAAYGKEGKELDILVAAKYDEDRDYGHAGEDGGLIENEDHRLERVSRDEYMAYWRQHVGADSFKLQEVRKELEMIQADKSVIASQKASIDEQILEVKGLLDQYKSDKERRRLELTGKATNFEKVLAHDAESIDVYSADLERYSTVIRRLLTGDLVALTEKYPQELTALANVTNAAEQYHQALAVGQTMYEQFNQDSKLTAAVLEVDEIIKKSLSITGLPEETIDTATEYLEAYDKTGETLDEALISRPQILKMGETAIHVRDMVMAKFPTIEPGLMRRGLNAVMKKDKPVTED